EQIHREVCERGYNSKRKAFTQFYGSDALDASLLTMPLVGFLPATDERVRNTIEAIERELMEDGFVVRYRPEECGVDGLPGREGVFIPCSFWLVACWHLLDRKKEAAESGPRQLRSRKNVSFCPGRQLGRVGQRAIAAQPDKRTHLQWWLRCAGHNCVAVCFHSDRAGYREC